MKIEQLQQFLVVVEEGSMNEAAQKLYVARSSLSTSMKNLETELGSPIFERTTRGVLLTPFGRSVYHQAQDICRRFQYLQNTPKTGNPEHLSVSSMYCSLANDALVEMYERHYKDGFTCNLEECVLFDVIQQVSTGLAEIGIVTVFSDGEPLALRKIEEAGLEFNLMIKRKLYAIIGPKNPLYDMESDEVTLEQLSEFPCVVNYTAPGDFSGERIWEGGKRKTAEILVSDFGSELQIISRTNAFAIDTYDKDTYRTFYAPNDCRFLKLKNAPIECKQGWLRAKTHTLSPTCEEYLDILKKKAADATRRQ